MTTDDLAARLVTVCASFSPDVVTTIQQQAEARYLTVDEFIRVAVMRELETSRVDRGMDDARQRLAEQIRERNFTLPEKD